VQSDVVVPNREDKSITFWWSLRIEQRNEHDSILPPISV
jgi:hypothetical protein